MQNLVLRKIQKDDVTHKISCGSSEANPLKTFLIKQALIYHEADVTKTYVLIDPEDSIARVYGYISIMNSEIKLNGEDAPNESETMKYYPSYPAIKIARLLVDSNLRGNGYGKQMLDWCASYVTNSIMPNVGCRFLAVDAKKYSIDFYKKNGFKIFTSDSDPQDDRPLMYIDLHKLKT